jgi:DNA-binding transcriptional MocR family regulator
VTADKLRELKPLFSWRSAICDSELPPSARHVALTLSLHMNERGGSCFPSISTLEAESGLSRNTVLTALRQLEDGGWITVKRSDRAVNRYTATLPAGAITALGEAAASATTAPGVARPSRQGGATTAPDLARPSRPNSPIELSTNSRAARTDYVPPPDPTRTQEAALRLVAPEDR